MGVAVGLYRRASATFSAAAALPTSTNDSASSFAYYYICAQASALALFA